MSPETLSDLETLTRKNYNSHNAVRGRGPPGRAVPSAPRHAEGPAPMPPTPQSPPRQSSA